jgi:hypothetical protein
MLASGSLHTGTQPTSAMDALQAARAAFDRHGRVGEDHQLRLEVDARDKDRRD